MLKVAVVSTVAMSKRVICSSQKFQDNGKHCRAVPETTLNICLVRLARPLPHFAALMRQVGWRVDAIEPTCDSDLARRDSGKLARLCPLVGWVVPHSWHDYYCSACAHSPSTPRAKRRTPSGLGG